MSNLWNLRDLPLPVMNTCRIDDTNLNLHFYRKTISEAVDTFQKQPHLHAEATLLSRYIYRMKMKLRSDHGLKEMQKVNTAVRRYLTLDLPKVLQEFLEFLPESKGAEVYYPMLGNLDYILIRLQGTAKLMIRAAECARYCALYMKNRISIGHLWKVAYIALGIVARLYALSKNLVKVCCTLYNNLFAMRRFLNGDSSYVGPDYIFPDKLEEWLNEKWLFEETVVEDVVVDVNEKLLRFRSMDDSDLEYSGEYIEIDDDVEWINEYVDITGRTKGGVLNTVSSLKVSNGEENSSIIITEDDEDIGEAIVPEMIDNSLNEIKSKNKQKSRKKIKLDIQEVPKEEDDIGEAVPRINKNLLRNKGLTGREIKVLKRKSSEAMNVNEGCGKKKKKFGNETTEVVKGKVKKKKENLGDEKETQKKNVDLSNPGNIVRKTSIKKEKKLSTAVDLVQGVVKKKNLHADFKGTAKKKKTRITDGSSDDTLISQNKHNKTTESNQKKINNKTKEENVPHVSVKKTKMNSALAVIESIKTISELRVFVLKENKMRDVNVKKCKLKHLNKMQWNMLNNLVTDLVRKAKKNEAKSSKFLKKGKDALLMNVE